MRINGLGPSVVTAVKIQQITRRQPVSVPTSPQAIGDVLDLSTAGIKAVGARKGGSVSQIRQFFRSAMRVARRVFLASS
jgi:hypothetical protein